jgi:hypothetical protein
MSACYVKLKIRQGTTHFLNENPHFQHLFFEIPTPSLHLGHLENFPINKNVIEHIKKPIIPILKIKKFTTNNPIKVMNNKRSINDGIESRITSFNRNSFI